MSMDTMWPEQLIWPARLPCPTVDYSYAPKGAFIRTDMDSGRARHRRRFRTIATRVTVVWLIPRESMKDFRYFVFEIVGRAGWGFFKTPLMFDDQEKMMRARFVNPDEPFTVANTGNIMWSVSAELEVFELDLMGQGDYYDRNADQLALTPEWSPFADYIRDRNILDLALNKEWPENN